MAVRFPWKWLVGFVVIVALSFTLFQVADVGLTQAGTDTITVTNESQTVSFTGEVLVNVSGDRYTQGFEDDERVWNSSGHELTEPDDYDFNTTSGGLTFNNTTSLTAGESVNVTYNYSQTVEEAREGDAVLQPVIEGIPRWTLIAAALFFAGLMIWMAYWVRGALTSSRQLGVRGGR